MKHKILVVDDKPNTLKVYVDNSHQRNSRWYSGSGIYRPVWLRVGGGVHVPPWGVYVRTPEIVTGSARVNVCTRVDNTTDQAQQVTLRSRVIGPDGFGGTVDRPTADQEDRRADPKPERQSRHARRGPGVGTDTHDQVAFSGQPKLRIEITIRVLF